MNKKLILLPIFAMMLVGCNTNKPASSEVKPSSGSEEPASSEPEPAPEPKLVFSITRDSVPDLADETKFDGSTYLAAESHFTVAERAFTTSGGKTFGRAAQANAAGSYELKAMQLKKADGYIVSDASISGFTSLTVELVTTYATNPYDKLLALSYKATAEAEFTAVLPKESTGDLNGVDTGKKNGDYAVYKFELHYENLKAGFYKLGAPSGNATYPTAFNFYE